MPHYLSRAQVRELDERATLEFGMPSILLMENAGRNAAQLLVTNDCPKRVVICCGKGNNGGDGFVMARHLDCMGVEVCVLLFAPSSSLRNDAAINWEILRRAAIPNREIAWPADRAEVETLLMESEVLVDALFGTGLASALATPYDAVIEFINRSPARVFAVDVPSGLDCDTGETLGATVEAEVTATFVACKKGFTNPGSGRWLGSVHVLDIGAPRRLVEEYLGQG